MVAVEKTVRKEALEAEGSAGCECGGTGTVSHWSEIAYFEDRRVCTRCEAGRTVDSRIADIIKRAQLEERLSRR
jgi:hypothetical protein